MELTRDALEFASRSADAPESLSAGQASGRPEALAEVELKQAIETACSRIAPLWTLRNFVAVNPYQGFTAGSFDEAVDEIDRLFHARALMPPAFYREAFTSGRIETRDLETALTRHRSQLVARGEEPVAGQDVAWLHEAIRGDLPEKDPSARAATFAEAIDRVNGTRFADLVTDEIAKWCATRFDVGQAAWASPWRDDPLYEGWKAAAVLDRSPEVRGVKGFRAYVKGLPESPEAVIAGVLRQLAVPSGSVDSFLTRALASIGGWAGHLQYRAREAAMGGDRDDSLVELLAIRLAFDGALAAARPDDAAARAEFVRGMAGRSPAAADPAATNAPPTPVARFLWQAAYEIAFQRQLIAKLAANRPDGSPGEAPRPRVQAAFCIDVRSEVLRRHLERQSPDIQTIGFAGFFGFPLELVPAGLEEGAPRCPVLIRPEPRIRARGPEGSDVEHRVARARERRKLFTSIRKLSVGAFPMVETVGHFFGFRLVTDALGWTRSHAGGALHADHASDELEPSIECEQRGAHRYGLTLDERVAMAEGALRNMGLTDRFAPIVLLCGHGSTTTNNPYDSGLDCGACGGHAGDVNARVASRVLNDPDVRAALAERDIAIPGDTRFVAGLHDTTRDEVRLFDDEGVDAATLAGLRHWLEAAGRETRRERAASLGERDDAGVHRRIQRRARDWSEVRPEWGLAGNAAFVAAPRERTKGVSLEGRVFLHDYEAAKDPNGDVLELIMTAPLVVATWINFQYYASTVDNDVFGSGNKVLHNVVGRHGVMLGNRSDLKTGLPWQSVHDGTRYVHEPLRLTAVIEAPRARVEKVLGDHPELRQLFAGGWIHLIVRDPDSGDLHRWTGGDASAGEGPWQDDA